MPFQLSFVNHRSRGGSRYQVNIPQAQDTFDSIRAEYSEMLKRQIARSNNGIVRSKYITFGISAADLAAARPRLARVGADIMGNFKRLGGHSRSRPASSSTSGQPSKPFLLRPEPGKAGVRVRLSL